MRIAYLVVVDNKEHHECKLYSGITRLGGGNFKLVMNKSSHRFGLAASLGRASVKLLGRASVLGFTALTSDRSGSLSEP